jgi:hypothetical protein
MKVRDFNIVSNLEKIRMIISRLNEISVDEKIITIADFQNLSQSAHTILTKLFNAVDLED